MKHFPYLAAPGIVGAALFMASPHPAMAADAAIAASISEFATPSQFSTPQGIDIASDGSVWYAETSAGKIAVFRKDHSSVEFPVPNGGQPFILKAGADSIWFTDSGTDAIGHLDPTNGKIVEYKIPSGAAPFFIQIAADGSKWFSETAGIGRLSPDGRITEWSVTLEHADDNIEQLSLDPYGNVWFAERNFDGAGAAGTNKVRRLNPITNVISTYLVPTYGGTPAGVLANADGTVWVSEYYANAVALLFPLLAPHSDALVEPDTASATHQVASVSKIVTGPASATDTSVNPSAGVIRPAVAKGWVEYVIPTADAEPEDMRTDAFGRLWFEEDAGLLGSLNPLLARFTQYAIPSKNSGYYNIVLDGHTNRLWFTEAGVFAPVTTKIGYLDSEH